MNKYLVLTILVFVAPFFTAPAQNKVVESAAGDEPGIGLFTLKAGNLKLVIDGNTGSRVISLKLEEGELLGSKNLHPKFYGSSLWLSPEGKWIGQGLLDFGAYKAERFTDHFLQLVSQEDSARGFAFTKQFSANQYDTSFSIQYTIRNISKNEQSVSPWEVTRLPTGGLAFYPKGSIASLPKSNLKVQDSLDVVWYPYDSSTTDHEKLFMKGSEGWSAYLHEGLVFIKQFPIVKNDQMAPGETDVEIYVNKKKTYLEMENQGIYQALAPGAALNYTVKWYARRLPPGLKMETGNKALVNYIRELLKAK